MSVVTFLPHVCFGLFIGAWVDRVDRRRLLATVDFCDAFVVASIPIVLFLRHDFLWWIYVASFISNALGVAFDSAQPSAIVNLVPRDALARANGRLEASTAVADMIGPILAGVLVVFVSASLLLFVDAASFFCSTFFLLRIRTSFQGAEEEAEASTTLSGIRAAVQEGVTYLWRNSQLRMIMLMSAALNFAFPVTLAQLVLFASRYLKATPTQLGALYTAGSIGTIACSLLVDRLYARFRLNVIAFSSAITLGIAIIVMASWPVYWSALVWWAIASGVIVMWRISMASFRQAVVPQMLLARVQTTTTLLSAVAIIVGSFLGGLLIVWTNDIAFVYRAIGGFIIIVTVIFSLTGLNNLALSVPTPFTNSEE